MRPREQKKKPRQTIEPQKVAYQKPLPSFDDFERFGLDWWDSIRQTSPYYKCAINDLYLLYDNISSTIRTVSSIYLLHHSKHYNKNNFDYTFHAHDVLLFHFGSTFLGGVAMLWQEK